MQTFTVASATALCSIIASRCTSTSVEVDEILKAAASSAATTSALANIGIALQSINSKAESLQEQLSSSSTISPAVQNELLSKLKQCESSLAIINKQISRLRSVDPELEISEAVVSDYEAFLELQAHLFGYYTSILQA